MNFTHLMSGVGLAFAQLSSTAFAGPIDPDCTPEKGKDVVKK